MPEQPPKPNPTIKNSSLGSLKKSLFSSSRLKPGEVPPKEVREQAATSSVIERPAVEAVPEKREAAEPKAPLQINEVSEALSPTSVTYTPASTESQKPASKPGPRKPRLARAAVGSIQRRRDASVSSGRQVAVRLSSATCQELDKIYKDIKEASQLQDPLKDAEIVRVAVEFLLRVIGVRNISLAQAYEGDARYSLILGESRVETILLEFLESEVVNLLKK